MNGIRTFAQKVFLLYGFFLLLAYLLFRIQLVNFAPSLVFFSILLLIAELHNVSQFFTMIYSLWPRNYPVFRRFYRNRKADVVLFICVCGEPEEIVRETILAAKQAVDRYKKVLHPHRIPKIVVLNDGFAAKRDNAKAIKALCKELGVLHAARRKTTGFKAGNINFGLRTFVPAHAFESVVIILDADFAVVPNFLLEITKPFVDTSIDFVQTPQRYKGANTWIAQAAAAHQVHFFSHVCPAKAYDNGLFLCGTNFAIRRSALDAVGGMDERFITEDYATSLNLHLAGKKGTFINKPLAYGVAPSSLKAYFSQQQRWSKGTFDTSLVYLRQILFGPLTLQQKYQYFVSSIYYLSGIRNLIFILSPLPFLLFGLSLINTNMVGYLGIVYGPLFLYNFLIYFLLFEHPLKSWVLDTISFPVFIAAFFSSITKKNLAFVVTLKKHHQDNILQAYKVQLLVIALLLIGFSMGISKHHVPHSLGEYLNYFWATFNTSVLSLGFYLFLKDKYRASFDGFPIPLRRIVSNTYFVFEKVSFAFAVIALLFIAASQNPQVKEIVDRMQTVTAATSESEEVLIPSSGVYYGYYLPQLNTHPQNPSTTIIDGEHTSLAMFYQDWGEKKQFDGAFLQRLSDQHVLPILTWEPWDATVAKDGTIDQSKYYPRVITSGAYDAFIHEFAREAAAYKKPYVLRFAHEMNGNWYPWGNIAHNTPEDYKAMWVHVHDIFVQEGATNTIWLWAPNNEDEHGSTDSLLAYYPGKDYVDWVGFSGFNWGEKDATHWLTFEDIATRVYGEFEPLGKPIIVAETSSVGTGGDKAAWFAQTIKSLEDMPEIKGIVFYNDNDRNSDFTLSSGMDIAAFVQEHIKDNTYMIKTPFFMHHLSFRQENTLFGKDILHVFANEK